MLTRRRAKAPSEQFALAAEAVFHGAFDLAVCCLLGDLTPLVVLLLAACDGDLELDDATLGVELEGIRVFPSSWLLPMRRSISFLCNSSLRSRVGSCRSCLAFAYGEM